jgi:hypothetical protein
MKERPDYVVYRAKRIWYLACKLAAVKISWTAYATLSAFIDHLQANRYLEYDSLKQEFSIKTASVVSSGEKGPDVPSRTELIALLRCFGLSANPDDHQGSG